MEGAQMCLIHSTEVQSLNLRDLKMNKGGACPGHSPAKCYFPLGTDVHGHTAVQPESSFLTIPCW